MSNFQFYESRVFTTIFHLIVLCQLFYAMNFEWNMNTPDTPGVPKMLRQDVFGGRSRFLTYWCLIPRTEMPKKGTGASNRGVYLSLIKLLHLIGSVLFCYGLFYDFSYVPALAPNRNFGGKLKYLTIIDAILQAGYFIIALLNDFFGSNEALPEKTPMIRRVKDYIFSAFAYPVALNVGITFWTLYWIDRELVFPKALDAFFPNWLNHVMHSCVVVFIVMEMFTSFRQYPSRKLGLTGLSVFMAAYLSWIHVIKYKANIWVYPVLEVLNPFQRIIFFAISFLFTVALYFLGEFVNEKVWVKEIKLSSKAKSLKAK